jgi:hypothetical protein
MDAYLLQCRWYVKLGPVKSGLFAPGNGVNAIVQQVASSDEMSKTGRLRWPGSTH